MSVCQVGCQSFQAKSLPCPQSGLISYPLERNVHDALPSPPLNGEKYLITFDFSNRALLHLSFTTVIIGLCRFLLAISLPIHSFYWGSQVVSSAFPPPSFQQSQASVVSMRSSCQARQANSSLHGLSILFPGSTHHPVAV